MKVLIVSSTNSGQVSPFVSEQVESVKKLGVEFEFYNVEGHGSLGYLENVIPLRKKIKAFRPYLIHAHYGLSGMLTLLSKGRIPLITTFHGNDINSIHPLKKLKFNWNKALSRIVHLMSNHSIFVTQEIADKIDANTSKTDVIPCQVNMDTFYPIDKSIARETLKMPLSKRFVLFSSSFKTPIKNYPLAKRACSHFDNLELIELSGYSRQEVNLLLNACDMALLTSYNEGSNQFIKEAMACGCPIVSTKVGDSEWIIGNLEGCFLSGFEVEDVVQNIKKALEFSKKTGRTKGRERIIELKLDAENISSRVFEIYKKSLNNVRYLRYN